jgi:hypothetical protein
MYTLRLPGRRARDGRFLLLAALLIVPVSN